MTIKIRSSDHNEIVLNGMDTPQVFNLSQILCDKHRIKKKHTELFPRNVYSNHIVCKYRILPPAKPEIPFDTSNQQSQSQQNLTLDAVFENIAHSYSPEAVVSAATETPPTNRTRCANPSAQIYRELRESHQLQQQPPPPATIFKRRREPSSSHSHEDHQAMLMGTCNNLQQQQNRDATHE